MLDKEKKIIVWVSWWPDSMFLQNYLIEKFWKEKIIIAHFNHKFRNESDKEEKFLKEYFNNKWIKFISDSYNWNDFREATLRKKRYDFFKKIGWWNYFLALGHNLTDRIETSLMNIARWWGLKWFLNMKKLDLKRKIYRPLLDLTKEDIEKKCKEKNIPYFIDETNYDENISKRNFIRKNILPLFKELDKDFLYKFNKLYNQIEKILPQFDISSYLTKINQDKYLLKIPDNNLEYFIRELLDYFWVYDFRAWVISEIINYINYAKWGGFKKYGNLIISKKNNKIFISIENWQN
jgi:tRNA(Ile)-lysidine synthase